MQWSPDYSLCESHLPFGAGRERARRVLKCKQAASKGKRETHPPLRMSRAFHDDKSPGSAGGLIVAMGDR